jgi:group I intron endonuclease
MYTYKAINTLNGKFYIGSTVNFGKRKAQHLNSKLNLPFQNALRKYPEMFEWEIWQDEYKEPILEQSLLDMWCGKEQCYNINPNADRPSIESSIQNGNLAVTRQFGIFNPEWRQSESFNAHQRKAGMKGGQAVAERRIGFVSLEYMTSEQYKETRQENGRKLMADKKGLFSPEYLNSVERQLMLQRCAEDRGRPVQMITPEGESLSFVSIREACRKTGMNRLAICQLADGKPIKGKWNQWQVYYLPNEP